MINALTYSADKFKSSSELEELLCESAKRNSLVAASCCFVVALLGSSFGYGYIVNILIVLMSFGFLIISLRTTRMNFRVYERITFVLSTFVVICLLFLSNTVTTLVIFLPCLAYLFFVESSMLVRWSTVAAIVGAILISNSWFFPNLAVGASSFDLRYESMFDVLLAAIFTGVFVRFHMEFMRLAVLSASRQAENHEKYVMASKIAYDSLASQKNDLDRVYEAARLALLNERLAHAQIAASQDQLEQFAYAASHDLKEPIRTIRSFLQVVRRRLPAAVVNEEGLAEHFEFVEQSSESMHQLLERLLVYSRIEKASLSKKSVGLVGVLQRLCSDKTLGLGAVGAEVSVDLPDELSEVEMYVNPEHAMVIFKELISNAILFRSQERVLKINIEADCVDDSQLLISFSDNGIGIEKEYHEQVFGLFKRLNAREDFPGSGLGLSLVKAIVEAADGEVSLTSLLGKGTQIHLLLPRKSA